GTGSGYPRYSNVKNKPERGYDNLAVFYGACTFDCLFCQNWHYRLNTKKLAPAMSAAELASNVKEDTSCICYFGGDPTAQVAHAISASKIALENNRGRILRICWETNGTMNTPYLKAAAALSLESGGCIKIDLKAWDESLSQALCGVSNNQTKKNIRFLADYGKERPEVPFLVVSTLLVPGYVDVSQVGKIAEFLASLDPEIPYSLLAFHPDFEMSDMPVTSKNEAEACYDEAKKAGLTRVKLGNVHLLM
ncbi:MAG: radical SAM protein, partial [Thermoplasmata archaeon]